MSRPKGSTLTESHKEAIRKAHLENGAIVAAVRAGTIVLPDPEEEDKTEEGMCTECSD